MAQGSTTVEGKLSPESQRLLAWLRDIGERYDAQAAAEAEFYDKGHSDGYADGYHDAEVEVEDAYQDAWNAGQVAGRAEAQENDGNDTGYQEWVEIAEQRAETIKRLESGARSATEAWTDGYKTAQTWKHLSNPAPRSFGWTAYWAYRIGYTYGRLVT